MKLPSLRKRMVNGFFWMAMHPNMNKLSDKGTRLGAMTPVHAAAVRNIRNAVAEISGRRRIGLVNHNGE